MRAIAHLAATYLSLVNSLGNSGELSIRLGNKNDKPISANLLTFGLGYNLR